MKILLVHPSQLDHRGRPLKYEKLVMPTLTLPTIAALTPRDVEVSILHDAIEEIDYDQQVDLVGITALTNHAPRAYQIAGEFRKRGRTVVIGGMHATALPEEALQHADCVVLGEAENVWPRLVEDFRGSGRLDPTYKDDELPDLQQLVIPRFDLMNIDKCVKPPFNDVPVMLIHTTRGCPFRCSFCTVTRFFGSEFRTKPVEHVVAEIQHSKAKNLFFVDDNIIANERYAEQLFRALIPLKITWSSQISMTALKNPRLIELAGESGCNDLLVGIESIDRRNLRSINKSFNRVEQYREMFRLLVANGISPQVTLMVGLDHDDPEVLDRTTDFLLENDILFFRICAATPYPGTELYQQLDAEGRILDRDWSKYDMTRVVFQPRKMSREALQDKLWEMYSRTFSLSGIGRRLWRMRRLYFGRHWRKHSLVYDLTYQLYGRKVTRMQLDPLSDLPLSND